MQRRSVVLLSFLLLACGKPGKTPQDMLPLEVQGWKRGQPTELASLPDGAAAGAEALYLGDGRVNVRVLQYANETVAFEKLQQWRQSEGMAAYKGPFFFIAQPLEGATRESTMALLSALKDYGSR
jgi:hypothetical protein